MDEVEDEEKCPLLAHGGPLAQLTVRAVPEADLAYCGISIYGKQISRARDIYY